MTININCRFKKFTHLICDDKGQFWVLPHTSKKKKLPLRKVKIVTHANSPHINYKNHKVSLNSLRQMASVVEEVYELKDADNLPF